jgi:nucleoside-diphosphate-sugar epimerase
VLRGSVADLDVLRQGAAEADGVIHTAFNHDFSRFAANAAEDRLAIETLGSALEGSERPLLATSGLAGLAQGRLATEADAAPPPAPEWPRASEAAAEAVAARGVRAGVVRLPPPTHGAGDHGFVPILIDIARQRGSAAYVGDGSNRWPATHRRDAARVYRLALEEGAAGAPYHPIAEEGLPFRVIAEAIGKGLGVPVISVSPEGAAEHFGWFARFAAMDLAASGARTRERLGWAPTEPGLIEDMAAHYFG